MLPASIANCEIPPVAKGTSLRILVALASYGDKNAPFLRRVLAEYRSMPYSVDVVVLSNIPKDLGPDIDVRTGLPSRDPWSLPFGHKQLFAERADRYDLFIYAEDDILISRRNIEAFLEISRHLPPGLIAGFVHAETDERGGLHFDPVHSHFHWDPASVRAIGGDTFAYHSNEHSACYLLTQEQLRGAIRSGGFLVGPHEGRYDMLCTASTDPYTQCGLRKMVCLSRLDDFSVLHLPNNKYAERPYRAGAVFHRQIEALLDLERNGRPRSLLFEPETKVLHAKWSKDYYEPVREDILAMVPADARSVLTVGCGWCATERQLVERGVRVTGIPIDSVIGACAGQQGIEVVYGDFQAARRQLRGRRFDCILLVNVLHLLPDPAAVLASFSELLQAQGAVVIATPNFASLSTYLRRLTGHPAHKLLGSYRASGIHRTSGRRVSRWLNSCGLRQTAVHRVFSPRAERIHRAALGLPGNLLAEELVIVARPKS